MKGAVCLRVIAGTARRVPLIAPQGLNTRPTSDRAKESLFSILGGRVSGARFLDLFCGSGSIGIEALSRGAKEAVFVENSSAALKTIHANLTKTKLERTADVMAVTVKEAIVVLAAKCRRFDIIFLDPPYADDFLTQTLKDLESAGILADGGLIVAETDSQLTVETPDVLTLEDTRTYGRTRFLFLSLGA